MMQDTPKIVIFATGIFLSSYKAANIIKIQNELQQQLLLQIIEYNQ